MIELGEIYLHANSHSDILIYELREFNMKFDTQVVHCTVNRYTHITMPLAMNDNG